MQTLSQYSTAKVTKFGRGATILTARQPEGFSLDDIRANAPAIFAEGKHSSRSERYTYIPTGDVVRGLMDNGFRAMEVRQGGSRDDEKRGFTKHMIRLRHSDAKNELVGGSQVSPEVVIVNSHDGTSSYQLFEGAFRFICTNGLIFGDISKSIKVPHKGNVIDRVIDASFEVIENSKNTVEQARELHAIELNRDEQHVFARAALAYRFEDVATAPVDPAQVIQARRIADQTPTLWNVFNRAQENQIRGGLHGSTFNAETRERRRVTTRPVNGIDGNRDLNRALHTLATEFAKLKAA
jgi:hypothetical protein